MSERLRPPDGSVTTGTVWQTRCPLCQMPQEYKRPVVPVDLLNDERRRAEAAEAKLREAGL